MIAFFRRIRQNLLKENKTAKYLKYAIGEILLVVIGILIALQINNWNEGRKARSQEQVILGVLHTDFSHNLSVFNKAVSVHRRTLNSCDIIIRNMENTDPIILRDSVARIGTVAFSSTSFDSHNGMVESLINSGSIRVITNDSLRNFLISWKDVLEDYKEEEEIGIEFFKNIVEPYLLERIDFFNVNSGRSLETVTDPKFKNIVLRQRSYAQGVINSSEQEPIRRYINEIIRLTSAELP